MFGRSHHWAHHLATLAIQLLRMSWNKSMIMFPVLNFSMAGLYSEMMNRSSWLPAIACSTLYLIWSWVRPTSLSTSLTPGAKLACMQLRSMHTAALALGSSFFKAMCDSCLPSALIFSSRNISCKFLMFFCCRDMISSYSFSTFCF